MTEIGRMVPRPPPIGGSFMQSVSDLILVIYDTADRINNFSEEMQPVLESYSLFKTKMGTTLSRNRTG